VRSVLKERYVSINLAPSFILNYPIQVGMMKVIGKRDEVITKLLKFNNRLGTMHKGFFLKRYFNISFLVLFLS